MWHSVETTGKEIPGKISHHTSVVHHDKMYLMGGSESTGLENSNMFSLDLKSFRWEVVNAVKNIINNFILERRYSRFKR